jgi:hypothetical protein
MLLYYTEQDNILQTLFTLIKCDGFRHIWERIDMIKKKLLKITLITTVIATILVSSGCGKKTANNDETTVQAVTVSAETSSNAAKELTKTGLVTFEYTDPDGNIYTLEGKAVASETGEAVIEVTDAEGNKVTFTGNAKTVDGKLSVSDIAVKDAGTLVKADGNKIEVTTSAIVADASESTEGESNSDIAASDDIKQEVETAKKEESVIEAAREEVTKAESNVAANDNVIPEEPKNDTPVTSEEPKQDAQVTPAEPDVTPDEPKQDTSDTPAEPDTTPAEPKQDTSNTPAEPDVTPAEPKQDTPVTPSEPEPEKPAATHMETKYIYFHDMNGGIHFKDSVTYLAYEDGTPVEETIYTEENAYNDGVNTFPDSGDPDKFIFYWLLTDKPSYVTEDLIPYIFSEINLADYSGDIHMYPGWI